MPRHFALPFLLLHLLGGSADEVAEYTTETLHVPQGNNGKTSALDVMVPTKPGERAVQGAGEVYAEVEASWKVMVESNQAGLVDPKQAHLASQPLHEQEAWHHHNAAQNGVVDSARFLATFTMVPSIQRGGSRLFLAAAHNNHALIEHLISEGDDPNVQKLSDHSTPLHAAVTMCHPESVKVLLKNGANSELTGKSGATALMMASTVGCDAAVMEILEHEKGQNDEQGFYDIVNYRHAFAGTTALHFAAEMGRGETIKTLCSYGADIYRQNTKSGGVPLHTAADTNQSDAIDALLGHCIDLLAERRIDDDAEGDEETRPERLNSARKHLLGSYLTKLMMGDTTVIYLAAQRGFAEVIRQLVGYGASIDFAMPRGGFKGDIQKVGASDEGFYGEKNNEVGNGATALHASVENGHMGATVALLKLGARQRPVMENASPLLIAVQYKHPDIAKVLLDMMTDQDEIAQYTKGAGSPLVVPSDGSTALFAAIGEGAKFVPFIQHLFATKPSLARSMLHHKKRHQDGFVTPLSYTLAKGDFHASLFLLKQDTRGLLIDPNSKIEKEKEDLYVYAAMEGGNEECVELILNALKNVKAGFDVNAFDAKKEVNPVLGCLSRRYCKEGVLRMIVTKFGADLKVKVGSTKANIFHLATRSAATMDFFLNLPDETKAPLLPLLKESAGKRLHWATPLYLAAQDGRADVIQRILSTEPGKATLNTALLKLKVSPLHIAVENGHISVIKTLLSSGANFKQKTKSGETVLHAMHGLASMKAFMEAFKEHHEMDDLKALFGEADLRGVTPLMKMLLEAKERGRRGGYAGLVEIFAKSSDLKERDGNGFGVVHAAAVGGVGLQTLQMLTSLGAALGHKEDVSPTPLMIACARHRPDHVQHLLQAGDSPINYNTTAFHFASRHDPPRGTHCEVCALLINAGLDPATPDAEGKKVDYKIRTMLKTGYQNERKEEKKEEGEEEEEQRNRRKAEFMKRKRQKGGEEEEL